MDDPGKDERLIDRRRQGDLGEASAIDWLTRLGAVVFAPIGHSPDVDLVAELDGAVLRVQVKTSIRRLPTSSGEERWEVRIATAGGNRSSSGRIKRMDPDRFDHLFVLTGGGRRWMVPAGAIESTNSLALGGPAYASYEIEPVEAIRGIVYGPAALQSPAPEGEYPSGQRMATVNRPAQPSEVRILSPPLQRLPRQRFSPSRYERRLGRSGRARINPKRRVTIPQRAVLEAGLEVGDRLSVRCEGAGRIVLQRIEPLAGVPAEARPDLPTDAGGERT
jgi:bifunctional DNA-binding transcriptional regulator/antitoxin component of YhaV-PrlF toxin-antitoxin module